MNDKMVPVRVTMPMHMLDFFMVVLDNVSDEMLAEFTPTDEEVAALRKFVGDACEVIEFSSHDKPPTIDMKIEVMS